MAKINEKFLQTTVAIGVMANQKHIWYATGFFVFKKLEVDPKVGIVFLITNKHVIKDKDTIWIRFFNKLTSKIDSLRIPLYGNNGRPRWLADHTNELVDVVAIPLSNVATKVMKYTYIDIEDNSLTLSSFLAEGGYIGTDVFMLGFPLGLINLENQYPMYRSGCVSAIIKSENKYVLDIQNFPGNSGSPIFALFDSVSIEGSKQLNNIMLIGIVNSYIPYIDNLYSSQTQKFVEQRQENSGLAYVFSTDHIKKIISPFMILSNKNYKK